MLSSLDFTRYSPRIYYISQGDSLSERKALALEASKAAAYRSHTVRAVLSDSEVLSDLNSRLWPRPTDFGDEVTLV